MRWVMGHMWVGPMSRSIPARVERLDRTPSDRLDGQGRPHEATIDREAKG